MLQQSGIKMADVKNHITQLNSKLQLLLKQYAVLVSENATQKIKIKKLQETAEQQKSAFEKLQQEQLILKASLDKMDEADKKKLEQKINGYVRNIDKCISLLSHKNTV